ncbi:MAG: hypothetical protein AAF423_11200 [Pseudomonadota bacterium]
MFFQAKPTIADDDLDWQLDCWQWLLENLGGVDALRSYQTVLPSHEYFIKSGKKGHEHALHVFSEVCSYFRINPEQFQLVQQEEELDPVMGPLHVVQNLPQGPLGTYSMDEVQRHAISYSPKILSDLEQLIATFAHEVCHPILLSFSEQPPGGNEAEEFATDLAVVFHGFGIFGGNGSFKFQQFTNHDNQGWSFNRNGYLTQNEWGFAIALRALLTNDDLELALKYASDGLASNICKNLKFLTKNIELVDDLR